MALWRSYRRAPSGVLGIAGIAFIALVAAAAPSLWSDPATEISLEAQNARPSLEHLLGTDTLGRDLLARLLVATSVSLSQAIVAVFLSSTIGMLAGVGAVMLPPRLRGLGLRTLDGVLAFPGILIAITIITVTGTGVRGAVVGVACAGAFGFARVVSTLVLSVTARDYVLAARVLGVSGRRRLMRYVLPNIAEVLILAVTAGVSSAIIALSGLSFLGLGTSAPVFDWGRLLAEGVSAVYVTPLAAIGPAFAIAFTAISFGLTGEALARAMNPLVWHERRSRTTPPAPEPSLPFVPGPARDDVLVEVRDLAVTFASPEGVVRAVAGVSFDVRRGEILGIVGESGCGKTMTALAIAQLVPYPGRVEGRVTFRGQILDELPTYELAELLGTRMAMVFQDSTSSLNPALKIGEQLTDNVEVHRRISHRDATVQAIARLREVSVAAPEAQLRRYPHELSGGMRQRVVLAMALMNDLDLLIADEATTMSDLVTQAQIMDLLAAVNESRRTAVILISHSLALVRQNCDRVLVMYAGKIVEELPSERLIADARHPYTRALLAAIPDPGRPKDRPLVQIEGQTPDPAAPPSGCPFHPRCPLAIERCATELPPLLLTAPGHRSACWVANADLPVRENGGR